MSFRRKGEANKALPKALPVFSVDTEQDAEDLIALTCSMAQDGTGRYSWPGFYDASRSAREQVDQLHVVGAKMAKLYGILKARKGGE